MVDSIFSSDFRESTRCSFSSRIKSLVCRPLFCETEPSRTLSIKGGVLARTSGINVKPRLLIK